jgi:hypothetical protein
MSALEVIAKPNFSKATLKWLVRLRHERANSEGAPQFTLVFPGSDLPPSDFIRHVARACAVVPCIRFCLRSAIVVPDLDVSWFHVFLVPDEGFGAIIRLHDKLYSGPLADCLRPEMPYLPHLTVASVRDFAEARRIATALNAQELALSGHVDEIEVHVRDPGLAGVLTKVALAHHGFFA